MSNLLSTTDISFFTGAIASHFDTFTYNRTRTIIVHKEPYKTITSGPTVFGYGSESTPNNVTFTPCSGIYPAQIKYDPEQTTEMLPSIKNINNIGEVRIKIEKNARDFIEDGRKVEGIEFDGKYYNLFSSEGTLNYLGYKFYIYKLMNTN